MLKEDRSYIYILWGAIGAVILFHGSLVWTTMPETYDAYVHLFFADHYAHHWFELWNPKWYTGFAMTGYPPLVHQSIGLISLGIGLKPAFSVFAITILVILVIGMYRFARLWVSPTAASLAALYLAFASCIVETLHIFGQLPTLTGLSFLLNALPDIYKGIRWRSNSRLIMGLSLMSVATAAHHVTTLFGMVFFVAPVMGLAWLDYSREEDTHPGLKTYLIALKSLLPRIIPTVIMIPVILAGTIFPYWYWSKKDPIAQIPIPHGSRDSFFEEPTSGLMFFIIPLGLELLLLPFILKRVLDRRNFFLGISFCLMLLLGTGGTTPVPEKLLGTNAFNILTLDRFSFWAAILGCVFMGEYFARTKQKIFWGFATLLLVIPIVNLPKFRPMQPQAIDMQPIVNFLTQDQHNRWRFLTLGFGDQMAWLSTQTDALSVDGNYHSARRLPELTTRAVERLENAKFKGVEGIGSLRQFLVNPEKYYLKFIFSNDKFYDPLLYFTGWERVQRLENGIMIWQKPDISPMPSKINTKVYPPLHALLWGTIPFLAVIFALLIQGYVRLIMPQKQFVYPFTFPVISGRFRYFYYVWILIIGGISGYMIYPFLFPQKQSTPEAAIKHYYDALDFKYFDKAYAFFDKAAGLSYEQYNLERSVVDGVVASYAKLNGIYPQVTLISPVRAVAKVKTEWVTPLDKYETVYEHELVKREGRWYIIPSPVKDSKPPEVLIQKPTILYHNIGRRTLSLNATQHEDILDRPELYITEAALIQSDTSYAIVGEIQNIDNSPAYITLTGTLYDAYNRPLSVSNCGMTVKHKLLPKETTSFRIDVQFIETGTDLAGKIPVKFKLEARGLITDNDLFKNLDCMNFYIKEDSINGFLYNQGTEEVSIPQLLTTYTDKQKRILWVENTFLRESIRPERSTLIRYPMADITRIKRIYQGGKADLFVNGVPNYLFIPKETGVQKDFSPAYFPFLHGFCYFQTNGYIANPTIY